MEIRGTNGSFRWFVKYRCKYFCGTIFLIYRRITKQEIPVEERAFLQPGKNQVAAGILFMALLPCWFI